MCIEDLRINRRKYERKAINTTDSNNSRRPGSRSLLIGPLTDHGETTLIIGANETRTALRVAFTPSMVYNDEDNHWVIQEGLMLGFPIPNGETDLFSISGPIIPWIALSTKTLLADSITIEDAGNLIYSPWGFIAFSEVASENGTTIAVTDISADRVVMAAAQGENVNLGG